MAEWSPAKKDKQGRELRGGYPVSGPTRARALAEAGKKTDRDGLVSDEAIATAKARLPKGDKG
jgi:hypothetical protein